MSIVACRVTDNGYEIAADSITVRGYTQTKGQTMNLAKLFEVNGIVFGCVGFVEESSLMKIFAGTHKPAAATESALLEFLSEFSDWKNNKTGTPGIENSYLIGYQGQVFIVDGWMVGKVTSYEAIGAGMDFALTALHLGQSAEEAVTVAIELSVFCEGPVQVVRS